MLHPASWWTPRVILCHTSRLSQCWHTLASIAFKCIERCSQLLSCCSKILSFGSFNIIQSKLCKWCTILFISQHSAKCTIIHWLPKTISTWMLPTSPQHWPSMINHNKAVSLCSQAYAFSIAATSKIPPSKPCTNVPTRCSLCPEVHWKYNILDHLMERHPLWQSQVNAKTRQAWEISDEEKQRFGMTEMVTSAEPSTQLVVLLLSQTNEFLISPRNSLHKIKQQCWKVQKTGCFSSVQDENVEPSFNYCY
jgi:hypothetical protein